MSRFSLCLLIFSGLFSQTTSAQDLWWQAILSSAPVEQIQQAITTGGAWYRCETQDSTEAFCLDDFHYYHQHLYGESTIEDREVYLSFLTEYQPQSLSELILNLRKDGLVMQKVEIDGQQYDISEAMRHATPEEVDKELIVFINRYPQQAPRSIDWVLAQEFGTPTPRLNVMLNSDGEMIELKVIRF
ncbi:MULTISPECIES: hypothetical protein [Vibrio]|jgi:hypothetical protein|uniref:Uncharacterized protein n=2 Tax=Vibrio harveyi TaxID=669 RepID=A0ABN4L6B5_VIBHA|nr:MULTISPECIES: hypothetical protein [Vibrio]AIV07375.1 hypothetical protein LA59_18130 [Vibrio harveyi]AMG01127.1 hypothetical protein AL538_26075 [Vibrio harveyi]AWB01400.1 hypothetical protein CU052_19245 [Vibrio harveyi]EKO3811430.1 hypothetical protein [Vibrio harveyi]EKO3821249.1 hypothetical protein [Vibrio harveyi]